MTPIKKAENRYSQRNSAKKKQKKNNHNKKKYYQEQDEFAIKVIFKDYLGLNKIKFNDIMAAYKRTLKEIEDCTKIGEPPDFDSIFGIPLERVELKDYTSSHTQEKKAENYSGKFCDYLKDAPEYGENMEIHHQLPLSLGGGNNNSNMMKMPLAEHKFIHKVIDAQLSVLKNSPHNQDIYIPISNNAIYSDYEHGANPNSNDFLDCLERNYVEVIEEKRIKEKQTKCAELFNFVFEHQKTKVYG